MSKPQPATPETDLLSLAEATRYLGISRATMARMLAQGDITGLRVGRQWRFRMADLMNFTMRRPHELGADVLSDLEAEVVALSSQLRAIGSEPPADDPGEVDPRFARVIYLCNCLLALALDSRASDIHMEPQEIDGSACLLTRFRIDGVLSVIRAMPRGIAEPVVDRLKLMAGLDLGERKQPQSGVIPVMRAGGRFQLAVATLPTTLGEAMTIGVSAPIPRIPTLDDVDLRGKDREAIQGLMAAPHGLVIFAGAAGSGKTTTLFAAVREVVGERVRTITLETTPCYELPYATRMQVNPRAGLGYPPAIRAAMRQDPDVLVLGEIADAETLDAAVDAALAGHLVVAVEGSATAVGAVAHLRDLTASGSRLADALTGVVAQRLLRRACTDCAVPATADAATMAELARIASLHSVALPENPRPVEARGCPACRMTGYRRRTAIYEVLPIGRSLRDLVRAGAGEIDLRDAAMAQGLHTLVADGLGRVADGATTLEEVVRCVG